MWLLRNAGCERRGHSLTVSLREWQHRAQLSSRRDYQNLLSLTVTFGRTSLSIFSFSFLYTHLKESFIFIEEWYRYTNNIYKYISMGKSYSTCVPHATFNKSVWDGGCFLAFGGSGILLSHHAQKISYFPKAEHDLFSALFLVVWSAGLITSHFSLCRICISPSHWP